MWGRLTADAKVLRISQLVSRSGVLGGRQSAPLEEGGGGGEEEEEEGGEEEEEEEGEKEVEEVEGEEDIDGTRLCNSHSFRVPRLCHRCNRLLAHKAQPKRGQQPSAFDS